MIKKISEFFLDKSNEKIFSEIIVNISGNLCFRCSTINEKTTTFTMMNGIPIVPISNDSPNRFTSIIEIINPGNTIDTLLSKTTINPNEKIIKTIELLDALSTSLSKSESYFSFLLFDLECLPTFRNFYSSI